jgi:6-phosphogluconolactonase (cycloisomerase 2 family)
VAASKRNKISQFKVTSSGALRALKPANVSGGQSPYGIAVNPHGTSVYAVDVGPSLQPANKVSQYTLNAATGRLTAKSPATVATGGGSESIAIAPNGESAYVGDHDTVSQYTINPSTEALTPKSPLTVAAVATTAAIAVALNGRYAYVATCGGCGYRRRKSSSAITAGPRISDQGSVKPSYLLEYRINSSTGALSAKPVASVPTGDGANWIAIAPNDRSAYVATGSDGGTVWQYTINPTTGKVKPKSPEAVATGGGTHNIVIAPNGKNAYVIGAFDGNVSQYRINPSTGSLGSRAVSTAPTVLDPEALAIAADGKNVYVTSGDVPKIAQYTINPATGKITSMTPATVKTAGGAFGLAVTP